MRVGIGYDIHKLAAGKKLKLGGVEIPHAKGPVGYSDADVLLHAVTDAILGAAGLGDIGKHFPDTDPRYKGISSLEILKETDALIRRKKYRINNIDTVVIAEKPKIGPFAARMIEEIAGAIGIDVSRVSVKAKTNEGLGSIGKGDAIASYAVVTLEEV